MKWCFIVLALGFLSQDVVHGHEKPVRRILILNEVGPTFPVTSLVDQGIRRGLDNAPYKLELYYEYFDATLFPDPAEQKTFHKFYVRKYKNHMPDVIITIGPQPLHFMIAAHRNFFRGVPVVFCLPNGLIPGSPAVDHDFTGVETDFATVETVRAALRLDPGADNLVVVGGVAAYDRQRETLVKKQLSYYTAGHLKVSYLTDLAMPILLEHLKRLPPHTVVLLTAIGRDAAGTTFNSTESGTMIAAAANAPVFSMSDLYLGHGEVGGDVADLSHQGEIVANIALTILAGRHPHDIPSVKGALTYKFDWHAMQRWRLKASKLPPGSVVINRPPSLWRVYEEYVLFAIFLFLAQALLILTLLWQRAKRRQFEARLAKSEEKFSKAFRRSPLAITLTRIDDCRYVEINDSFERHTGWRRNEVVGRTPFDINFWVDPKQRSEFTKELLTAGAVRDIEVNFRTRDGQFRTGLGSAELIDIDGEQCVLSVMADITELKRAEEAMRESEQRFRLVANTAPVMIWMSAPNRQFSYFNQPWLDFRGHNLENELANKWIEGIHPEDRQRWLNMDIEAFECLEPLTIEYRLRRYDGEYRWILDSRVPRFHPNGAFAGFIGSAIDVTERKLAEEALSTVSQRLIEAHEEERTWIARELHDDIGQGLTLLAITLDRLQQQPTAAKSTLMNEIQRAAKQAEELTSDVHVLSHHLHSSKLELLGLAAAASGFCREFADQQKVEINFQCDNFPKELPKETALCLFRVLQEALQNGVKHSGSRCFQASIVGDTESIELTVRDSGVGFDVEEASQTPGLGLTSIKERLKLVHGQLSIESQPHGGTTIHARVPLSLRVNVTTS